MLKPLTFIYIYANLSSPACRLMQQSVESVWNMAFDFILDNVQVVLQQTYGSTLKVT